MAQVATVGKVETHKTAVGRHDGLVDLEVGRAAAEALDVDTPLGRVEVEGLEGTALAQQLDLVNVLVATVVTGAGQTLRVLVGHGGAQGIEDGAGGDVLRGNENNGLALTLDLIFLQGVLVNRVGGSLEWRGRGAGTNHDGSDLGVRLEKRLLKHL